VWLDMLTFQPGGAFVGPETLARVDPRGCLMVNTGLEMAPRDPLLA
jgi:hypothetical protein